MFQISKDNLAYYLTSVTKDRLPIFRTEELANIACRALDEARRSAGFLIFAYVEMPDHLHVVTDAKLSTRETHRYVNGIIGRRVIDHLKAQGHQISLDKLQIQERPGKWKYSLWQHHPDTRLLWNEQMLWQRIQYTHLNPVRAGLADRPVDWQWSSARILQGPTLESEPLSVDLKEIDWRKSEAQPH